MSIYSILWLAWGAAFVGIEGTALLTQKAGGTLSETVWRWFGVPGNWTWKRYALLAFLVWLLGHLAFGWWAA